MSNDMKDAPPNTKLISTSVLQLRGNIFNRPMTKPCYQMVNGLVYGLEGHMIILSRDQNKFRFNRPNDSNGCRAKLWIYWWIRPKDISGCFNSKSLRGFHFETLTNF